MPLAFLICTDLYKRVQAICMFFPEAFRLDNVTICDTRCDWKSVGVEQSFIKAL